MECESNQRMSCGCERESVGEIGKTRSNDLRVHKKNIERKKETCSQVEAKLYPLEMATDLWRFGGLVLFAMSFSLVFEN